MVSKVRVLFVCVANAARSQIAEALLHRYEPERYEVFSAGTKPSTVDPRALEALLEVGILVQEPRSKSINEFAGMQFDYVITLCDKSTQECQYLPNATEILAWNLEDPAASDDPQAFHKTRVEINERIKMFLLLKSKKH